MEGKNLLTEPYAYVMEGGFTGEKRPVSAWSSRPENFSGLETLTAEKAAVQVSGPGRISMDFDVEFAGWLEIDAPDFSGELTLGVSEYNQPVSVSITSAERM